MKTITANRLVLVDSNKKPRIILDASWPDGIATVDLYSLSGAAVKLWIDKDGLPKMAVEREDARFAVTAALNREGEVTLSFYDRQGKHLIRLGRWDTNEEASIDIFEKGKVIWSSRRGKRKKKRTR